MRRGFSLLELLIVAAILVIIASILIPSLLRSRQAANEASPLSNLRTIMTAQVIFASQKAGKFATMDDLRAAGLVDERFAKVVSGYTFHVEVKGKAYTVTAEPVSSNTGRYGYLVREDGVVRYSTKTALAPPGLAGQPVQ